MMPTEAEKRFEAMQTLAFGARGLLWFTYWMPRGVPEPQSWKHSLILADGSRDPHYDMVKRINADVKAIGDRTLTLPLYPGMTSDEVDAVIGALA